MISAPKTSFIGSLYLTSKPLNSGGEGLAEIRFTSCCVACLDVPSKVFATKSITTRLLFNPFSKFNASFLLISTKLLALVTLFIISSLTSAMISS